MVNEDAESICSSRNECQASTKLFCRIHEISLMTCAHFHTVCELFDVVPPALL